MIVTALLLVACSVGLSQTQVVLYPQTILPPEAMAAFIAKDNSTPGSDPAVRALPAKPSTTVTCPAPSICNSRNCCRYYIPANTGTANYICVLDRNQPPQYFDTMQTPAPPPLVLTNAMSCYVDRCGSACALNTLRCGGTPCTSITGNAAFTFCDVPGLSPTA